jgi:outer membrane protein TolC
VAADETLLNYNAMMKDLFVLLAEARARITANIQAVEARRDFWVASVDLQAAIIGGRGGESPDIPTTTTAAAGAEPAGH